MKHIGISLGNVRHWHDGLGEFSHRLGLALAAQAPGLREQGIALHFHLPSAWHGRFGTDVHYLDTHDLQRLVHLRGLRFALWHRLHQHNRFQAPLGTRQLVETVHDLNFLYTKHGAKQLRYCMRLRRQLSRCDTVVAITHYVARDLLQHIPTLSVPVEVIHNGVSDLTGAPQQPIEAVRGQPFLLHLSRMATNKNVGTLLDMAAVWPAQRFLLAGADSPDVREIARQASERQLHNVIVQRDLTDAQKAWAYAHCQGLLFPSLAEGFGLPPLEAMHFGKPVFLSRLTSLPEVGGDVAFYFDSFEPQAMRDVVEQGLQRSGGQAFSQRIAAHARGFSWQQCAAQYLALYQRRLNA